MPRKTIVSVVFCCLLLLLNACDQDTSTPTTQKDELDSKVSDLLSKMTVEEKAGQLTQVNIDMILEDDSDIKVDPVKLRKAIIEKKVGSILNVKGRDYSIEEWHSLLSQIQKLAVEETPNKIPILYGIDAIHGANFITGSTLFPHNIGLAASRNPEIVKQGSKITAKETRASGVRWNFDPVVGMGRQPLWPRFEETFGEDVYLTSTMGVASIEGYEEDGLTSETAVAACMKHFLGYSVPLTGKDRTPSYIPELQMRNIFLPPFRAATEAGVSTVMINSGEVNGIPVHASKYYLQDILRDELGFRGVAVSDWEDIIRLHTRHRVADSHKEAVKIAVNAGVDMSMVPLDYSFYDYLVELVNEKEVSMERLDEAAGRILKLKMKLGLFDNPYPEEGAKANFAKPAYREAARNAAAESLTLLKNEDNILPLKENSRVLLAGPGVDNVATLNGSWSYTWQGSELERYPQDMLTIRQAFEQALGTKNVFTISEKEYNAENNFNGRAVAKLARKVDYVILCLGENAYAESPGVIDDLVLDKNQLDLAEAVSAAGKPMIMILTEGRPRVISPIEQLFQGILMAYRPGSQGALAIADAITGKINPSGRLPFTYPRFSGDVVLYDYKGTELVRETEPNTYGSGGYLPQYPFGHGLSYTTFAYSELKTDTDVLDANGKISVSVEVENTGNREGQTTVELYTKDLYASVTPEAKRLRKFSKIKLGPGETKTVNFTLNAADLSFVNQQGKRTTEAGDFELYIGDLTGKFAYREK